MPHLPSPNVMQQRVPRWHLPTIASKDPTRKVVPVGDSLQGAAKMTDVYLNVYDLGEVWLGPNSVMSDILHVGGAFHVGVQVHGREIYFGSDGVATCAPRASEAHVYRQTVRMGKTRLTQAEVEQLVKQMCWKKTDYDLLRQNCVSFADVLCKKLVGRGLPSQVCRFPRALAVAARGLEPMLDLSSLIKRAVNAS